MAEIRIIARDGGGIRKIMPEMVAVELARRLGSPLAYHFNLDYGTSGGGQDTALSALVGGKPIRTEAAILNLTLENGPEIFHRSRLRKVESGDFLFRAKYSTDPFRQAVENVVGDLKLSDVQNDIFLPASNVQTQRPHYFQSAPARDGSKDQPAAAWDYYLSDAILGTSAAPTYFKPHHCKNMLGEEFEVADGGLYANNPAAKALAQAVSLYGPHHTYYVLSLGTGTTQRPFGVGSEKDWGPAQWALHILPFVFNLNAAATEDDVEILLKHNVARSQIDLLNHDSGTSAPNDDLDDASPDNLDRLRERGAEMVKNFDRQMDDFCQRCTAQPTASKEDLMAESAEFAEYARRFQRAPRTLSV